MDSIAKDTLELEVKPMASKKPLLLTRPKEEHSNELDVVKMVQKLSNKIVYKEKEKGSSSSRKLFNPYYKEREERGQTQPPLLNFVVLNFNEIGMDHLCTFHQEYHSERSCPQWINSMNLVMNQLLDAQLEDPEEEEEDQTNEREETIEETTMYYGIWHPHWG